MPGALALAFTNTRSILAPAIVSIFGKKAEQIIILLGGGPKPRQQHDIRLAFERWEGYKQRKKQQKEKDAE